MMNTFKMNPKMSVVKRSKIKYYLNSTIVDQLSKIWIRMPTVTMEWWMRHFRKCQSLHRRPNHFNTSRRYHQRQSPSWDKIMGSRPQWHHPQLLPCQKQMMQVRSLILVREASLEVRNYTLVFYAQNLFVNKWWIALNILKCRLSEVFYVNLKKKKMQFS